MNRSTERILVTHAGSLPQPADLREMVVARTRGEAPDPEVYARTLRSAVAGMVRRQIDCGIDIVNDGEMAKPNFLVYARERLSGFEQRPRSPDDRPAMIYGRDLVDFPEYFEQRAETVRGRHFQAICNAPLRYVGHGAVRADIENFRSALQGVKVKDAFLPAIAPGTVEHIIKNEYYPNDEAYLEAIADAMHEEYKAIVDAGFLLQIDDPDLPDGWQIQSAMTVREYRKFARLRIDALNYALRDLPVERVRFHTCWGSYHGPHKYDIPLKDIVDLILKVRAEAYSVESSNPRHEHEWRVWENVKFPPGKIFIPGVAGHVSDIIEHPELIAERLVRFAKLVGRENVIAGTDCGLGPRVGHPEVAWAKFQAMAKGAQLASKQLWARKPGGKASGTTGRKTVRKTSGKPGAKASGKAGRKKIVRASTKKTGKKAKSKKAR